MAHDRAALRLGHGFVLTFAHLTAVRVLLEAVLAVFLAPVLAARYLRQGDWWGIAFTHVTAMLVLLESMFALNAACPPAT